MARTGRPRGFDEEHIVAVAEDLFWRQGYGATSVQDLVDGVGLQRGSIYGAFGDKRALFLRALQRYVAETTAALTRFDHADPVIPEVRALLLEIVQRKPCDQARGCLLGNTAVELAPSDPAVGEIVRGGFTALEEALRRALTRARKSGELPPHAEPAAQARMLVVFLQGMQIVARVERDPARLTDAVDAVLAPLTGLPART